MAIDLLGISELAVPYDLIGSGSGNNPMPTVNDNYTYVRNISGSTMRFGFLPPHGVQLTNGQTYLVEGDLQDRLDTGGRVNERKRKALEYCLLNSLVAITKSKELQLYDGGSTLLNPTVAATLSGSAGGTASALSTGAYRAAYTFVNGYGGETTIGSSGSSAVTFTITTGHPQITLPALPVGAVSINIYLTQAGGIAGSEHLYLTGVTTTTVDIAAATYNGGTFASARVVPLANTTKNNVKKVQLSNGVFVTVDPSWGAYSGAQ